MKSNYQFEFHYYLGVYIVSTLLIIITTFIFNYSSVHTFVVSVPLTLRSEHDPQRGTE